MKYIVISLILFLALTSSILLSVIPIDQACGQEESGCYIVQASKYERTLGIKNANIGVVSFTILLIITILQIKRPSNIKRKIILAGLTIGSIWATYFLYLQFFILNATCPYCLMTDIGTILSLLIFIIWKEKR